MTGTPETAAGFDLSLVTRRKTTRIDFDPHRPQPFDGPAEFLSLHPGAARHRKLGFIHALTHRQGGGD
jgi:hypothetical protein